MIPPPGRLLSVKLWDQTYQIRASGDEEWARRVARMVDETMREIADATGLLDRTQVSVLASLNLADRLLSLRKDFDRINRETQELDQLLGEALP